MRAPGKGVETSIPTTGKVVFRMLVLAALGAAGCFLFQKQEVGQLAYNVSSLTPEEIARDSAEADSLYAPPRDSGKVEKSLDLALASVSPSNGYQGLWQAARAAAWLAENLPDKSSRETYARKGVAAGREAEKLAPDRVESWYYTAVDLGRLSDILRSPSFVKEMAASAEEAIRRDERFDRAGPHRFLGILNFETEGKPFVGYGDLDVALNHLKRAVELFPDDAENRVACADALIADEQYAEARRQLEAALSTKPFPGSEKEHGGALDHARELLKKIEGK